MNLERAAWSLVVLAAAAGGFMMRDATLPTLTAAALSPDGRMLAMIVERRSMLDRNFALMTEDKATKKKRTLFTSPDEGKPGGEKLIWSEDGMILLLGRTLFVEPDANLPNGDSLYLLVDSRTGEARGNATQRH